MSATQLRERVTTIKGERSTILREARVIIDKYLAENREPTAEERQEQTRILDRADTMIAEAGLLERQADAEDRDAESTGTVAGQADGGGEGEIRGSLDGSTPEQRDAAIQDVKALRAFNLSLAGEQSDDPEIRALQVDSQEAGGYVVTPTRWLMMLIQAVDDQIFIRGLATKQTVANAQSLGFPSLDADPADADWTQEILTGSEDSTMDFGKRELYPHPLAKLLKVSNKLIRAGGINVEQLVRERLAYKFAVPQEKGFLTGNGSGQPLGVFTASALGISTGRDVSTGNTTTGIQFDGLIEAKYTLKGAYWPRARWMFHRDGMKQIALLKDGEGQYIWRESVRAGEPDRVLNLPIMMSEFAPNTFTTGLYVGILGDWSRYWIADALSFQLQRLAELYAETNQIGFIGLLETDGMPVLEEAFVRVKLA
jgi:HK97 family phage major capsid protein